MSDNLEEPEVELYEVVGDEYWNSPVRVQTSSVVPVASASAKARKGLHFTAPLTVVDGLSKLLQRSPTHRGPTLETILN